MVCTGNICRSPMAQVLLARRLGERGVTATLESVSLHAAVGRPTDPIACELIVKCALDLSGRRARHVDAEMIRSTDLMLVMEAEQRREAEGINDSARGRIDGLGRIGRFDVPDPIGQGRAAFEQVRITIERGLGEPENVFWSPP
jgi:protein-tyrosine phosphatase